MEADKQLEIWKNVWRNNPNVLVGEEMPPPIASVREENEKAEQLVMQLKQLAEYSSSEDTEVRERRERNSGSDE